MLIIIICFFTRLSSLEYAVQGVVGFDGKGTEGLDNPSVSR